MTTPDALEVLKHLKRSLDYLTERARLLAAAGSPDDLRELRGMIEVVRGCERAIRGDHAPPTVPPNPNNLVCAVCGSLEIECLDWVRVNDDYFIGGIQSPNADDYWCPTCELHDEPFEAAEYCADHGHRGTPCAACGAS